LDASAAPFIRAGGPPAAAHSFEPRDRRNRTTGMTDATSAERGETALSRLVDLGTMLRRSDIGLAVAMVSCGGGTSSGGGGGGGSPSQSGTPAGPYVVTITGASSNPANPPQVVQLPFTVN